MAGTQPYVSSFYQTLGRVQGAYEDALIAANGGQQLPGGLNLATAGPSGTALFAATCPGNQWVSRWDYLKFGWAPSPPAPDLAPGAALCGCSGNIASF